MFSKFATELRALNDVRIQFLFNILRMNGQNLTKFYRHIIIDKMYIGIVNRHFFLYLNFIYKLLTWLCKKVTIVHFTSNIAEAGL